MYILMYVAYTYTAALVNPCKTDVHQHVDIFCIFSPLRDSGILASVSSTHLRLADTPFKNKNDVKPSATASTRWHQSYQAWRARGAPKATS